MDFKCPNVNCKKGFHTKAGLRYHQRTSVIQDCKRPHDKQSSDFNVSYINGDVVVTIQKNGVNQTLYLTQDSSELNNNEFRCMIKGCEKNYLTRAGLRYHLVNGHDVLPEVIIKLDAACGRKKTNQRAWLYENNDTESPEKRARLEEEEEDEEDEEESKSKESPIHFYPLSDGSYVTPLKDANQQHKLEENKIQAQAQATAPISFPHTISNTTTPFSFSPHSIVSHSSNPSDAKAQKVPVFLSLPLRYPTNILYHQQGTQSGGFPVSSKPDVSPPTLPIPIKPTSTTAFNAPSTVLPSIHNLLQPQASLPFNLNREKSTDYSTNSAFTTVKKPKPIQVTSTPPLSLLSKAADISTPTSLTTTQTPNPSNLSDLANFASLILLGSRPKQ